MKILIVDDSHDWLHSPLLARLLTKAGFTKIVRSDVSLFRMEHTEDCMQYAGDAEDVEPWACNCPRSLRGIDIVLADWQPYGPETVQYAQAFGVPVVVYTAEPAALPPDLSAPVVDKMYVGKYLVPALMMALGRKDNV